LQKTSVQAWDTGREIAVPPVARKRSLVPVLLGGVGLVFLAIIGAGGLWIAFRTGIIGSAPPTVANTNQTTTSTPQVPTVRAEMVFIPGGRFKMGRNDDGELSLPEHEETISSFYMDKTEVTNAAFYEFMVTSGYKPSSEEMFLAHWENGKPVPGDENKPVRYINIEDAKAFAEWRSKRDGVQYRLPTEQEWEYAARNGSKENLYPWGDKFEQRCAHINQPNNIPVVVGTKTCPNNWGVQDLIGNVFEWTGSQAWVYPGSNLTIGELPEPHYMIRGGGAFDKTTGPNAITSTFRFAAPASRRSPGLGFRLVRPK
ncbi:MAG: hypothetical protein C4325_14350, partial [Blastocatellia bacterium]